MARKKHDTKITTDAAGAARRDQADPAAAAPETTLLEASPLES